METFWIQYVVSYDNQEQRTLFKTVKKNLEDYKQDGFRWLVLIKARLNEWWQKARGDDGLRSSLGAIGYGFIYFGSLILICLRGHFYNSQTFGI